MFPTAQLMPGAGAEMYMWDRTRSRWCWICPSCALVVLACWFGCVYCATLTLCRYGGAGHALKHDALLPELTSLCVPPARPQSACCATCMRTASPFA